MTTPQTDAPTLTFNAMKPSDFVIAMSDDEGTKVGDVYRVVSIWRDLNGGQGITVELPDGCGAGLNEGEYAPLVPADALDARDAVIADLVEALRERDGGAHDVDCKFVRDRGRRACTCGHVKANAAIAKAAALK